MKWISFARRISSDVTFAEPAARATIQAAELQLGTLLPDNLKEFLLESNGLWGSYALRIIWPVEEIVSENLSLRKNSDFAPYMPFDHLLFFGDAGNGDQFAYPIHARGLIRQDIFVWDHERDSRSGIAAGLADYIGRTLDGSLTV